MSEISRRHRINFGLKSLLLTTALVATLLGYTQWRRQAILREALALAPQGFTMLWKETWTNQIWPVIPKEAAIEYYELGPDQYKAGSKVYTEDEWNVMYHKACDRLRAQGVEYIRLDRGGTTGDTYTQINYGRPSETAQTEAH
jgi:hypothetical protein